MGTPGAPPNPARIATTPPPSLPAPFADPTRPAETVSAFPVARPATFELLAELPDDRIDVAIGAALMARDAYATLDVDRLVARFDELAAPLLPPSRDLTGLSAAAQADAVSAHLYG